MAKQTQLIKTNTNNSPPRGSRFNDEQQQQQQQQQQAQRDISSGDFQFDDEYLEYDDFAVSGQGAGTNNIRTGKGTGQGKQKGDNIYSSKHTRQYENRPKTAKR